MLTPPCGTQPHLNSVSLGVEVGGPHTLGSRGVGGATPSAATTTATIAVVVVILLLAGLLGPLLVLLLS
jgi:hypothetical protein